MNFSRNHIGQPVGSIWGALSTCVMSVAVWFNESILGRQARWLCSKWRRGWRLTLLIDWSIDQGYNGAPQAFIATQGPLLHTVGDFWDMVWQERSRIIIMLTRLKENNEVRRPAALFSVQPVLGSRLQNVCWFSRNVSCTGHSRGRWGQGWWRKSKRRAVKTWGRKRRKGGWGSLADLSSEWGTSKRNAGSLWLI